MHKFNEIDIIKSTSFIVHHGMGKQNKVYALMIFLNTGTIWFFSMKKKMYVN